MALRTTGHLLLGVVRIYSRKAKYLLSDCNDAFHKIKMAFRPGAAVDLPQQAIEANFNTISLPEVFHDFDSALPDFNDLEYDQNLSLNQSRIDDITIKEDIPAMTYGLQEEAFGADDFDTLETARGSLAQSGDGFHFDGNLPPAGEVNSMTSLRDSFPLGVDIDAPVTDGFGDQFDVDDDGALGGPRVGDEVAMDVDDEFGRRRRKSVGPEAMDDDGGGSALGVQPEDQNFGADFSSHLTTTTLTKVGSDNTTTEVTTLIQNEEDSFALAPLDATSATGIEKRPKRKRRLIVDELKSITGEDMKFQLNDCSDIVTTLDLAPPTKKLMGFKETGGAEKMFNSLGFWFASKQVLKLLTSNAAYKSKRDEVAGVGGDADALLPLDELGASAGGLPPSAAATPRAGDDVDFLEERRNSDASATFGMAAIAEETMPGDQSSALAPPPDAAMEDDYARQGGLPSVSPQPDPFGPPHNVDDAMAPPSPRKERKSRGSGNTSKENTNLAMDDDHFMDDAECLDASQEDKQWGSRTQQLLVTMRNKFRHSDYVNFVDLCARKDNRKIAAQKFYTLLVLKKWRAIDVEQTEPFGYIKISQGPRLNESITVG